MKINKIMITTALMFAMIGTVGCNKFSDKKPYSISPQEFFNTGDQLNAYAIARYSLFPSGKGWWSIGPTASGDNGTDNQVGVSGNNMFLPGDRKVPQSGDWNWVNMYTINYFFEHVMPKVEAGSITGDLSVANQAIGEMYFFRAYEYFNKLKAIGDCPIVLTPSSLDKEMLLKKSVRQPRNMVARQILKDLDSAVEFLPETTNGGNNRISKNVALLFKSRVALYEGSWERNFKGTAFVPNGEGWTGKATHPNYVYDADVEIKFFLEEAMESAKIVADAITLTNSPADYDYVNGGAVTGSNGYYEMFATSGQGLKTSQEVLLFRAYDISLGVTHHMVRYLRHGGGTGYTEQYMQNFLMRNGLPIYNTSSGYSGNREIKDVKENRDSRLQIFVQAPEEKLDNGELKTAVVPPLLYIAEEKSTTGYSIKKRIAVNANDHVEGSGTTGEIIFRGTEALLNYIEASCLLNDGISIDGIAIGYWARIRERANVDSDYTKTVNATIMTEEAKVDLAAYTAGKLIGKLEYNIRRERRCEFIAENFRWDDLKRYRALDQLISEREFVPQGFPLWDYYHTVKPSAYYGDDGKLLLIEKNNVSENKDFTINGNELMEGKYLYPMRIADNNAYFKGYKFLAAHYLNAIGVTHLLNAATGSSENITVENSVIYQNPGWGVIVGGTPTAISGLN